MHMTESRRVVAGLLITATLTLVVSAITWSRVRYWQRAGWVGANIMAAYEAPSKVRKRQSFAAPGRVFMVMPDTPASRAGLRPDDRILSINGVGIDDLRNLEQLHESARAGDVLRYVFRRGRDQRVADIRLEPPFSKMRTWIVATATILIAAMFLGIGIFVFLRRPDDSRATVFYALASGGGLSLIGSLAAGLDSSQLRGIPILDTPGIGMLLVTVIGFAFVGLTLHLALVFPKSRPVLISRPYVVRWIYSIPAAAVASVVSASAILPIAVKATRSTDVARLTGHSIMAAATLGLLMALRVAHRGRTEGTKEAFLSRPLQMTFSILAGLVALALIAGRSGFHRLSAILTILCAALPLIAVLSYPILTCVALYRSYREAGVEEKRQVKWPLWGTFLATVIKIVTFITGALIGIYFSTHSDNVDNWAGLFTTLEVVPRLSYLLIPISFAFAILKYRLMNIDIIVKKTVTYAILSGAIVFVYLVVVAGLGTLLVRVAHVTNQAMVIAATLVVALAFVPVRNKLQYLVDRNLFRQKYDYQDALRAIATQTLAANDLDHFLHAASEVMQQALQNRNVVLLLRRENELVATAKVGVADTIVGALRTPLTADLLEVLDRPFDPRRRAMPAAAAQGLARVEPALIVPLRSQGTVQGAISFGAKLSDREYDLEDIEFLSAAADQIAMGIDRVRMGREETELSQAREMQQTLLPREVPQIEGLDVSGKWLPARTVGGDYFDVIRLSATRLAVCIGDVAGKGMPAALLMSATQAAVRASADEDASPAAVCARVRRVILPTLSGGRFVTFFYGIFDTAERQFTYCNAGHNPPMVIRRDGTKLLADAGGAALSRLFRDEPFESAAIALDGGERVVLYTDGLTEARDQSGELFGEERLEALVQRASTATAAEIQRQLVDALTGFTGAEWEDDVTLLTIAVAVPAGG